MRLGFIALLSRGCHYFKCGISNDGIVRQALEPGQIKSQAQEQIVNGSAKPANKTQNNIVCENESCESRP